MFGRSGYCSLGPVVTRRFISKGHARCDRPEHKIPLNEILNGFHPQYSTNHLKHRLLKSGLKHKQCELCINSDTTLSFVLDHIDGDCTNHKLENVRVLCPNCHSKTNTFAGRNKEIKKQLHGEEQFLDGLLANKENKTILQELGLVQNGANYRRVDRLRLIVEYVKRRVTE